MSELGPTIPRLITRTPCADKNDRLGWKVGFTVANSYGTVGVRTNDPSILAELQFPFLPEHFVDQLDVKSLISVFVGPPSKRKGSNNYHILYDGWTRMVRSLDLAEVKNAYQRYAGSFLLRASNQVHLPATLVSSSLGCLMLIGPIELRTRFLEAWPFEKPEFQSSLAVFEEDGTVFTAAPARERGEVLATSERKRPDYFIFLGTPGFRKVSPGEAAVLLFTEGVGSSGSERLKILGRVTESAQSAIVGGSDGASCWSYLRENAFVAVS